MNFGEAIEALKNGRRVERAGWNGKGQWVAYMPPMVIREDDVNERTRKHYPGGDLEVGGYLVLWTAQGVWQPGWVASQSDLLAADWSVLG